MNIKTFSHFAIDWDIEHHVILSPNWTFNSFEPLVRSFKNFVLVLVLKLSFNSSSQYPGRRNEMRLVGKEGIVTVNINEKEEAETDDNIIDNEKKGRTFSTSISQENLHIIIAETESLLPTSVLLQRIRVTPASPRRGKVVRRRRKRRRNKTAERSGEKRQADNVYFSPL